MKRLIVIVWLATCIAFSSAVADPGFSSLDVAKARQFIMEGVARASRILQAHTEPRKEISERLRAELRRGFDIPTIANFALGSARGKLPPEQRRLYEREFEELIVQTYTSRVIHYGPRIKTDISDIIRFTGHTPINENQVLLHSQVNRKGADWVKINWQVRRRRGEFAILDVMILGISQALLYKSEIEAVVNRNGRGVDGLLNAMRKKNQEIRSGW